MTREEFAAMLQNREKREEISDGEAEIAKQSGLLVCFGYSDDNLEFRGIIHDEIGAYDGTKEKLFLNKTTNTIELLVLNEDEAETIERLGLTPKTVEIEAIWDPEDLDASWLITTELPHSTFDIMEDGELFCRGIVVSETDIREALNK